ncbi:MAG: alpha/beta hydrolase-fold protein [Atopobiaceae bacterium]|jgi:esterase/lipase superfamily enzyme
MKCEHLCSLSTLLNQDMNVLVYGSAGWPVVAIPTQGGQASQWEDVGMIDELAPLIEGENIQLYCIDTIDEKTWLADGDKTERAALQERYYSYLVEELLPLIHAKNHSRQRPLAIGCDLGATEAALLALRRPDLFEGCIALSGYYHTNRFFGDWMDSTLYDNDVPAFLSNMEPNHPYVELYNQRHLVFCAGQGPRESCVDDLRILTEEFDRLSVHAWCDFWGFDVTHDWPWWKRQITYFLPTVLENLAPKDATNDKAANAAVNIATDESSPAQAPSETGSSSGKATKRTSKGTRRHKPTSCMDNVVDVPQAPADKKQSHEADTADAISWIEV